MEAVWTRFFPIVSALQDLLYKKRVLGRISRVFLDFGLDMPLASLPPSSRTADPRMGAGALLDIGIYTLTWATIVLGPENSGKRPPKIASSMSIVGGVDEMSSVILNYEDIGMQAICTSSMRAKSNPNFGRIEGEKGTILIGGVGTSKPGFLILELKGEEEKQIPFEVEGWGFYYEADAVAADLRAGRTQSEIMPWETTRSMMALMDEIRGQNGLKYAQDIE